MDSHFTIQMLKDRNNLDKRDLVSFGNGRLAAVIHKDEKENYTTITVHPIKKSRTRYLNAIKVWWWIKWFAFKLFCNKCKIKLIDTFKK